MRKGKRKTTGKRTANRKRARNTEARGFFESLNRVSHEKTNRRLNSRGKSVWASIAIEEYAETETVGSGTHLFRASLILLLLPLFWITAWTFLMRFSHATVEQGFWQSAQFWYFAVGAITMLGWFWSGLAQPVFLYLYVFGHELTHAAFVKCFGGRILDMDWGIEGGYVTTDKTNWLIALSPYFVPFWSLIAVIVYVAASLFFEILPLGNHIFYGVVGATWAFHLAWTLWMIPRDQPDLKDNGTFLSLILICLGNLLVLTALLCLASPSPVESLQHFATSWITTALTWGDASLRFLREFAQRF